LRNNKIANKQKGRIKTLKIIKPILIITILALFTLSAFTVNASAAEHYVVSGDTMWRISRSYGISLDKLIAANPQVKDPNLIYPGDKLYIPNASGQASSSTANQVLSITNKYRAQNGLKALTLDGELCRVAQAKADDMAAKGYFSHQSPTYGSPAEMLKVFGVSYRYMGENIAKGYYDAASVMDGWMNSSGHRANILNQNFTRLGVGYNATAKTWVQIFT